MSNLKTLKKFRGLNKNVYALHISGSYLFCTFSKCVNTIDSGSCCTWFLLFLHSYCFMINIISEVFICKRWMEHIICVVIGMIIAIMSMYNTTFDKLTCLEVHFESSVFIFTFIFHYFFKIINTILLYFNKRKK